MPTDVDNFASNLPNLTAPAVTSSAVTLSDSTDLAVIPRAIYVGAPGNIQLMLENDTTPVVLVGVAAGSILSVRPRRIYATNTSAGSIVALG